MKKVDVINGILSIVSEGYEDIIDLKSRLIVYLSDFEIVPSERLPAVYNGGKNELLFNRFLLAKMVAGRSEKTIAMYKEALHRVFASIGKDADLTTSLDVQMYIAKKKLEGNVSDCYLDNDRRVLCSFYDYLQTEEIIEKNPMKRVDKIKVEKRKKEALTDFEIEVLRNNLNNEKEKAIFEMLLSTGCRVSELVSIKKKEIDGDKVVVCGKGNKYRTVYVNARAKFAVQQWLEIRDDKNPYLFPKMNGCVTEKETGHMGSGSVQSCLKKLGIRSGVENVHPHRFRRTCATNALRSGMPIELVAKMLGHEKFDTTKIYLDIADEEVMIAHKKYVR